MADKVSIALELESKQYIAGMKKAEKATKESSAALSSFMGNLGANAFSAATSGLLKVASGFASIAKESVVAAIDAAETKSKFEAVFAGIGQSAQEAAKDLQDSYGLGVTESKTLLAATGDLLTGFGLSRKGALDLSVSVQKMSVDLASFTNFSGGAAGASEILTKAMLGETESLKGLGIAINADIIKRRIAADAAAGLTFENDKAAKSHAIMKLITEASGNAIGDYAKTSGGAANQMKLFNTRLEDAAIAFGEKFLPALEPAIKAANDFIASLDMQAIGDFVKKGLVFLIDGLVATVDYINPVITYFKLMGQSIKVAQNLYSALAAVVATEMATIAKATIDGISIIINAMPDALVPDGWKESIEGASNSLNNFIKGAKEQVVTDVGDIGDAFENVGVIISEKVVSEETLAKLRAGLSSVKEEVIASGAEVNEAVLASDAALQAARAEQQLVAKEALIEERVVAKDELTLFEEEKLAIQAQAGVNEALLASKQSGLSVAERHKLEKIALKEAHDHEKKMLAISQRAALEKASQTMGDDAKALAISQAKDANELSSLKLQVKQKNAIDVAASNQAKQLAALDNRVQKGYLDASLGFLQAGMNAVKGDTVERKALALAQATINTYMAASNAFATVPYPANIPAAASAVAIGLSQVSQITSAGTFQHGGIVGGNNFAGDNMTASVNSGEMILNKSQQTKLFNQANGGGGGSDVIEAISKLGDRILNLEIVVVADDNEIARSASRGVQGGIVIGSSR
jgi:hypothetical protein